MGDSQQPLIRTMDSWSHQCAAYHFAMERQGSLLGLDMGCGKSKIAVDAVVNRSATRTIVCCPVSVLGVWRREFERFAGSPCEVLVLDKGTVAKKTEAAERFVKLNAALHMPCVVVLNHESFWRQPFIAWALDVHWDALIVDECHRVKSNGAKVSRAVAALSQHVPFRLGLTGTPMPHSPLDIFGQARFLDPTIFGRSYHRFRDRYARVNRLFPSKVDAWINQDELQEKLKQFVFRVKASDVLDLPPVIHEQRRCDLNYHSRAAYKDLEKELIVKVATGEVTVANGMVKLLRLQQITSGFIGGVEGDASPASGQVQQVQPAGVQALGHEKEELLADLAEDLAGEPIVVFCRFRHDLEAVQRVAEKLGRRYGELSGKRRDLTPHATMPDDIDIMGVQIQSGGVGIDLTRACYCVYYSIGFSLGDYEQSLARVNRPGQTRPVRYYHLIANDTVDDTVYAALQKRADLVEAVLSVLRGV